jgi:MMP 1-O-methyltransferase
VVISAQLRELALATTGFMPVDEGDALHEAALAAAHSLPGLPLLEVGSYCGRSTIWLGDAARQADTVLFAVDHHRGSEGWTRFRFFVMQCFVPI